jgi:hypothetical protein
MVAEEANSINIQLEDLKLRNEDYSTEKILRQTISKSKVQPFNESIEET